jgi:beta-glucosidase/6-phospho-beta-glucosidase/beta-galactosidase
MFRGVGAVVLAALALFIAAPAQASHGAAFGVQDDAWLMYGPGTLSERLTTLQNLGVGVVRFTLRWDKVAAQKPASPRSETDYEWGPYGDVLDALHGQGIRVLVTLYG